MKHILVILSVLVLLLTFSGNLYAIDTTYGVTGNWWVEDTLFAKAVVADTIKGAIAEIDSEFAILWFKYVSPADPDSSAYRIFRTNNVAWQAANPTIANFLVITSNNTGLAVLDTLYVGRGIRSGRADIDSMIVRLIMGDGTGASTPDKYLYLESNSIVMGPADSGRVYVNAGDLGALDSYANSVFVIDDDIGGSVRSTSRLLQLYHDVNSAAGDTVTGDMYGLHTTVGYQGLEGFARRVVGGYFIATKNSGVRDKSIGLIAIGEEADTTIGIYAYSGVGGRAGYFGNGTLGKGNVFIQDTLWFGNPETFWIWGDTTDSSIVLFNGSEYFYLGDSANYADTSAYAVYSAYAVSSGEDSTWDSGTIGSATVGSLYVQGIIVGTGDAGVDGIDITANVQEDRDQALALDYDGLASNVSNSSDYNVQGDLVGVKGRVQNATGGYTGRAIGVKGIVETIDNDSTGKTIGGYFYADDGDSTYGILAYSKTGGRAGYFGNGTTGDGNVGIEDTLWLGYPQTAWVYFDTTDSSLIYYNGAEYFWLGDSANYADTADYVKYSPDSSWDSINVKNRVFVEGNIMFEVHAPTARDSDGGLYLDSASQTLMWVDGSGIFFNLLYPDSSSHADTASVVLVADSADGAVYADTSAYAVYSAYAVSSGEDSTWDNITVGTINEYASLNRLLINSDSVLIGEAGTGRISVNIGDLQNIGNFTNSVVTIDEDIGGKVRSTSRLLELYHDVNGTTGDTVTGDMYALYARAGYQGVDGFARRVVGGYFLATKNSGVRDKNTGLIAIGDEADTTIGIKAYSDVGGRAGYFGNGTSGDGNIQVEDTTFFGTGTDISSLSYITKSSTDSSLSYYDGINSVKLNRKSRVVSLDPYECAIIDTTFNSVSYKMDITDHTFISGDSIVPCLKFTTDSVNYQYNWLYVKWKIPQNYHEMDSVTVDLRRDATTSRFRGNLFNVDGDTYDRTDSTTYHTLEMVGGQTPGIWQTANFSATPLNLNFSAGDYLIMRLDAMVITGALLYLGNMEIYYREK